MIILYNTKEANTYRAFLSIPSTFRFKRWQWSENYTRRHYSLSSAFCWCENCVEHLLSLTEKKNILFNFLRTSRIKTRLIKVVNFNWKSSYLQLPPVFESTNNNLFLTLNLSNFSQLFFPATLSLIASCLSPIWYFTEDLSFHKHINFLFLFPSSPFSLFFYN